jgi:hypothetical protein
MIPFGTLSPVVVVEHRSWERNGDTFNVVRVRGVDEPETAEATEFFVAPGAGEIPAAGEIVHLRYGARAKGWETVIQADGTRKRRNGGTAHSIREFAPAQAKAA